MQCTELESEESGERFWRFKLPAEWSVNETVSVLFDRLENNTLLVRMENIDEDITGLTLSYQPTDPSTFSGLFVTHVSN